MTQQPDGQLDPGQMDALSRIFHRGATEASGALEKWLHLPSVVTVDAIEQVPLQDATSLLGTGDEPVCFCSMALHGVLTGQLIFVFDERSGLVLADFVLSRPADPDADRTWSDVETSAALETANVIGCAYLNVLQEHLPVADGESELLPSPPKFQRDYPQALLQFALMSQLVASDTVFLSESRFHVDGTPLDWTLLLVPDARSIEKLRQILPQ